MTTQKTDVIIIGAGPAGTVAASYLNRQNIRVIVIEKSKFPRFAIGESLIPKCMESFEEAGLLECLKKQNYQKKIGAGFIREGIAGEFDFSDKFSEGWDWTWQVPRDDFDQVLAQECIKNGVDILFETKINNIHISETKVAVAIEDNAGKKQKIEGKYIIDASGNARVLATKFGLNHPPQIENKSSIFTQVKDIRRPAGEAGTRITFEILQRDLWFWYIPFSNGNTSIGFVGSQEAINQFPKESRMEMLLTKIVKYRQQFENVPFMFEPIQMDNISKSVKQLYGNKFVLTGNSAEFLDPIFSSGVCFATESSLLAAKLILKELNGEKVDWQKEYEDYIKQGVNVFSTYVKSWYTGELQDIILHQNPNPEIKRQLCSVLAGYVWDQNNPFVSKHQKMLKPLHRLIKTEKKQPTNILDFK
ncbi:NAD(P)/FAD-dependent oxidoreductase [Mesonia sp. K7]|uniref:NAD(P)/FAD-dependent oxidoreductase n=1 Tax=Mesonia sp. K7 TaxID=2218606 RepID=UPI000DA799B1|nr:pyridine nucleotide-disulfide oxidoreductase [Mesonia sp. K7]